MAGRSGRGGGGVKVCVEGVPTRAFASALEWPGWCRSGRDEAAAVAALEEYRPRYAVVAEAAEMPFPGVGELTVVERATGTSTTRFGAPDVAAQAEQRPLTAAQAERMTALVGACWTVLDRVAAGAPWSLRKGPRGGGRDRDAIVAHVVEAEAAYARKLGLRSKAPNPGDAGAVAMFREQVLSALRACRRGEPMAERGWLPRYAARRIAWHALDHAWEIEDRS